MKKAYLLALLPSALLLNGCDAESEACRYYVKQDLDNQNFQAVIDKLENDASCQADYPENEFNVDLGTAYMGKAGMSLPKVMSAMIENDDEASNSKTNNQFSTFLTKVTDTASDTALLDLSKSRDAFISYLGQECADIPNPSNTQDGICLLTGFVDILKTTMAIDAMTGGQIAEWINDTEGNNAAMLRSPCALQYAFEHEHDVDSITPYTKCTKGTLIEELGSVTFSDGINEDKTYNDLLVTKDGEEHFLEATNGSGTTVFTKGFCHNDYTACADGEDDSVDGCYVCPISKGEADLNIQDFVLDALNSGFDNMDTLIQNVGGDSDDLRESLDDFRKEISCGEDRADDPSCELKEEFTMDDILDYLNKNQDAEALLF